MCGYPQFSLWISIVLAKIYFSRKVINCTKIHCTSVLVGTVFNFFGYCISMLISFKMAMKVYRDFVFYCNHLLYVLKLVLSNWIVV